MLRFRSLFALLGLSVGIFSAATARCADISVDNRSIQNLTVVFVVGALNEGDAEVFRKRVAPLSRAAVFLESEGGNLLAGIQLGEAIRLKGFSTAVTGICASACALAWLGGQPRFMTPVASVGIPCRVNQSKGSGIRNRNWQCLGRSVSNAHRLVLLNRSIRYAGLPQFHDLAHCEGRFPTRD